MRDTFENVDWLHEILEFSSTGLWRIVIDDNTGVNSMYASQSMLKLLGLDSHPSPEECYEHWFSRIGKEYVDYVVTSVGEMVATGEQIEVQYTWEHPSLGNIFVRCSGKLENTENNVYELRGYHQNITEIEFHKAKQQMSVEEMKTAQKISSLRNRTRRLSEQSQMWKTIMRTVLRKTDTFEVYYYPKTRTMSLPPDVAEKHLWDKEYTNMPQSFSVKHVDYEYQIVFEGVFESLHKGIETTNFEFSMENGKKWYNTNLSVIEHDENDEPVLAIGIIEDITERKINQLENIQLQSIYKFTVNNDYECLMIIDLESRQYSIRYTEGWDMFATSEESMAEENFKDLLTRTIQPKDIQKFDLNNIIERLNCKEEKTHIIWYTATNKEHKEAHFYWLEENKKLLITVRNIEKRWKQEKENKQKILEALEMAEAANQAKSDFLSRVSHDIRTPLNAVVGMVAVAKKHKHNITKVEECLDAITNSSNYLASLINDVLDMAKIENDKMTLTLGEFDMNEFLNKMMDIVQPLMNTRKHEFIVNRNELMHSKIIGDSVRLQQLLINILSNAVKYTNPGGRVEFTVNELPSDRENYGLYQFIVEDNGIGMDEEFLEKLFTPFERKDSERVGRIEGTGLGMSIAKSIASLMEGDIAVESEVDKGSKFTITIYFELQESAHGDMGVSEEEKSIPDFSGKNILLVEDNMVNIEIAQEIISVTGANIETAENGKEAVEILEQSEEGYYSMIFMDVRMPIMNGYEAVKLIRAMHRADMRSVPIIAMTADAFMEDIKKAKDCGMNDHIAKPIDIDRLYDVMRKYKR